MHNLLLRFKSFQTQRAPRYTPNAVWVSWQSLAFRALAVGTLVFGGVSGLLATRLSSRWVELILASLVGLLCVLGGSEYVILLLLTAGSTIFDIGSLPFLFGLSSASLCLLFLLGLLASKMLSGIDEWVRTPLDWPLLIFFGVSLVSFFNAVYNLGTVNGFRNEVSLVLLQYLVFFAVTNLVRTRRQLTTLVGGMFVLASIVAALMIVQQAVGQGTIIIPDQRGVLIAEALGQEIVGIIRVSIPGKAIVFAMLLPAFILHATSCVQNIRRWLLLIPIVLLPVAIAFTFDRNLWIGAILAGVAFVIISRRESKNFVLLILILVIMVAVLIPLLNGYIPRVGTMAEALYLRFNSLFAGDELVYDASTQQRLWENDLAMALILKHPFLGIGPNAIYRDPFWEGDVNTSYIHNGYLYLLVDMGIVGFLPFLCVSIVYIVRGIYGWYTLQDPILRGLVIGFTLTYIAILSSSTTSPRLLEEPFAPLIGVMFGINEVAIRLDRLSSRSKNEAA